MPQVHIVAYCGDLGYGVGARRRDAVADAGLRASSAGSPRASSPTASAASRTLLLGSALQCVALLLYLPFDGLTSLYVVSALFGLSQGGIVPSYAHHRARVLPAARGRRTRRPRADGDASSAWRSAAGCPGEIFDLTGSYRAAFLNGIAWNLLNLAIALWLLGQPRRMPAIA